MFAAFLAMLDRYPAAWSILLPLLIALAWAVISGIFNTLYDRFSPHTDPEWKEALDKHRVWGGIVAALKTGGFNLPGFLRALRVIFSGKQPAALDGVRTPKDALEAAKGVLLSAGYMVGRAEDGIAIELKPPAPSDTSTPVEGKDPQ